MSAGIAEMVAHELILYSVAALVLGVMSYAASAAALGGLDKLDAWLRRRDEDRLS